MNLLISLPNRSLSTGSLSHTWGTAPHERTLDFPCDPFIPAPTDAVYRGITIHAAPHVVFRWLCQLRAAPYSYDWIDNLGRPSPRELTPGLDQLAIGQAVMRDFELADFARDQHLTLRIKPGSLIQRVFGDAAVTYCLIATEAPGCRLLVKMVARYRPGVVGWLARTVMPWGDLIMMRRQLLNFKKLAERTTVELALQRTM